MKIGGWAFDIAVIEWIREHLASGSTILELGSGPGTGVLAERYRMFSVENSLDWVGKYDSTYIHAPLVGGRGPIRCRTARRWAWYDTDVLRREMPSEYDMILVDGPPGFIGRGGFLTNIHLFRRDVPILLDDTNRPEDAALRDRVAAAIGRDWEEFECASKKCFTVIVP